MKVWKDEMPGIKQYRRQIGKALPAWIYRKFEHSFVFGCESVEEIYKKEFAPFKLSYIPDPPPQEMFEMVIKGKTYQELLEDDKSNTFLT